jgi:hypothetical protein
MIDALATRQQFLYIFHIQSKLHATRSIFLTILHLLLGVVYGKCSFFRTAIASSNRFRITVRCCLTP